jgi:hypothetical protein
MLEDQQLKDMPWDDRKPAIHRRRPGGAGVHASQLVGPGRWFNDNIVFGSQEKMLTYTNYYDSVIKYFHEGICFNTETMLAVHAFKNGLEWCGTDVITYEVWRQTAFEY